MTTFTKVHQRKPYPAIDPSSPANSQAGRTVLITGGGAGIGFEIARAFVTASASQVIILGRRQDVLESAVTKLKASKPSSATTKILYFPCDIGDGTQLESFWKGLKDDGIEVDVLVLNAALTGHKNIGDGSEKVWKYYEVNVLANLRMTEKFLAQGPEKGKFLVNISTVAVHLNPSYSSSAYATSKASFTHLIQLLADEVPVEKCQILSCHPGRIFTDGAKAAGYNENSIPWDSIELPAVWCVWASTPQAAYLHGRFLWTDWSVNELAEMKEKLKDPGFLKLGLQGVDPVTPEALFAMT